MVDLEPTETSFFEGLWSRVPQLASDVLGSEVKLGAASYDQGAADPSGMYVATMSIEGPHSAHVFLYFEVESAIAFGGMLVMMQEKVIREKMSRRDMTEDDFDAMGECVNQLGSAFNESLRECMGDDFHARFATGEVAVPEALSAYEGERIVHATGKLDVGGLHEGRFTIVVPERVFKGDEAAKGEGGGLELSPEELEALRAATREGFADLSDALVVVQPVERNRAEWEELLEPTGMAVHFARNVWETRALCLEHGCGIVIVDADVSPSGGLPLLARLRTEPHVQAPLLVAASTPTRTHLVACLAAGAATYLVKPIEVDLLRDRMEQAVGAARGGP